MKKTIWIYGVLAGIISVTWGVLSAGPFSINVSLGTKLFLGYATMILAFSLIFVAIKNYRDAFNNGQITFGKGLSIGLLITLIASTVYVLIWMIDFSYFVPDYGAKYTAQTLAEMKASGASDAAIQKQRAELVTTFAKYNTNFTFRAMFTYFEILPVGILVSLIAAVILKKRNKLETA